MKYSFTDLTTRASCCRDIRMLQVCYNETPEELACRLDQIGIDFIGKITFLVSCPLIRDRVKRFSLLHVAAIAYLATVSYIGDHSFLHTIPKGGCITCH